MKTIQIVEQRLFRLIVITSLALLASSVCALTVPDTLDQRLKACSACHGDEGRATTAGYYPRIAG
jgi:cytochrome c553